MRQLSATQARRSPGAAISALADGPVVITRRGKRVAVLLSKEYYEKLSGIRIASETELRRLVEEGLASGTAEPVDVATLKAEARNG